MTVDLQKPTASDLGAAAGEDIPGTLSRLADTAVNKLEAWGTTDGPSQGATVSRPPLKPYLAGRHAVESLGTGSWILLCNTFAWIGHGDFEKEFLPARHAKRNAEKEAAGEPAATGQREPEEQKALTWKEWWEELKPRLLRLFIIGGAAWTAWYFGRSNPIVSVPIGVIIWCTASWTYAPPIESAASAISETVPAAGGEAAQPVAEKTQDDYTPEQLERLLTELLLDTIAEEGKAHLSHLARVLHREGDTWATSEALGKLYRRYGIPVRKQLDIRGKNNTGIHRDDLVHVRVAQAAPSPTPQEAPPRSSAAA